MTTPRRALDARDLLHGDDHEFVVNIYLAALRRWPDAAGHRHFLQQIANRPEHRGAALREITGSEEARRLGNLVDMSVPLVPGDPLRARDAMLALRTEVLQAEIAQLRSALELVSGVAGQEVATLQRDLAEARDAELRSELNGLRREVQAALASREQPSAEAAARADLAGGLARLLDAYLADRLAGLETRLAAVEARLPPP